MTSAQCRAARALLNWSQADLANIAQVGISTVRTFETDTAIPRRATLAMLVQALEKHGIVFLAAGDPALGDGVSLRQSADEGMKPEQLTSVNDG